MKEGKKSEVQNSIKENSVQHMSLNEESKIRRYFLKSIRRLNLCVILLFMCDIGLLTITIALGKAEGTLYNLKFATGGYFYQILNLILVIFISIMGAEKVLKAAKNIFRLDLSTESLPFLAFIGTILQATIIFINKDDFLNYKMPIYSFLYGTSLLMIYTSDLINTRRIRKNFRFLTSKFNKSVVIMEEDKSRIKNLFKINTKKNMVVAYQSKELEISKDINIFKEEKGKVKIMDKISYINWISAIFSFIWAIIVDRNIFIAIQNFTLVSCICIPLCNNFINNMILNKATKSLIKRGCMVNGESGIEKFYNVNCISISASELYPADRVSIKGIRTFGEQRIDDALLYASAIENNLDSTLTQVFEKALSYKITRYPKVSSVSYEGELGLVGWCDGKRVLVGNRELLKKYKVYPPSQVFEHKCCSKNQKSVYVAIKGELVAMFIISYKPDKNIIKSIKGLVNHGIKLFINTNDSSITKEMIARDFRVPIRSIKVISNEGIIQNGKTDNTLPDLITNGRVKPLLYGILSCIKTKYILTISKVILSLASVLGMMLLIALVINTGILQLGIGEPIIFCFFWPISIIIVMYIYGI